MTLRLLGVVASVGLADSINPSTVGPALYLATSRKAKLAVTEFTLGVFAVNLIAGIVLTIGPGRALLGLVPHPRGTVRHVIELVAGVIMIAVGVAVWLGRRRLARRELPMREGGGSSPLIAGASIAVIEFPTAFPYFAVIAAVVASRAGIAQQIVLIAVYNITYVLPLLAIVIVLLVAGDRADPWLQKAGAWLQHRWPVVLATLLLFIGGVLTVLGGSGLVKD
jgi:cytochrome c biogenesis protein CcdA